MQRRIALSYATGAVGTGIFATVPGLLLLYYLTDVIGVAAGIASLVLFLPKLWDVVLNPVVGAFSDRSGTRRPYLLAGAIVTPVMFALLFAAPNLGSPRHTALYVGIVYTLAMQGSSGLLDQLGRRAASQAAGRVQRAPDAAWNEKSRQESHCAPPCRSALLTSSGLGTYR